MSRSFRLPLVVAALALAVAGCESYEELSAPRVSERLVTGDDVIPAIRRFAPRPSGATAVARSNAEIAQDFLELSFFLESGRALPVFTRFEGPVSIAFSHPPPAAVAAELDSLVYRLRNEAGIDIRIAPPGSAAGINIVAVPRQTLRRTVPQAACFVVPRVTDWAEFIGNRRNPALDWATLERRDRVMVVIPSDTSLQETRDCLHEEIAQALGPLNDIYRLTDSVFNDDNVQGVLTPFDMLILRATYAPELRSGMSRDEVARRLPAILARLNPRGEGMGATARIPDPRDWTRAIETAMNPRHVQSRRLSEARDAIRLAERHGLSGPRLAFSHYVYGRLLGASDRAAARTALLKAEEIYSRSLGTDSMHHAFVDTQLATLALLGGNRAEARMRIDRSLPVARRHENASVLSTLMMLRAELLQAEGRHDEARVVRLDSIGWARYAFGSEDVVRSRLSEVAAIARRGGIRTGS